MKSRANTLLGLGLQTLTKSLLPTPPISLLAAATQTQNHRSESTSTVPPPPESHPAEEEAKKITTLLRRLCDSNHLHEAIRLTDALLLTNPPLHSISDSLHALTDRLSSEPTMTHSMSLLNRLKHTPSSSPSPFLPHINQLLIASYLHKKRFKEAVKVLHWVSRPDAPPCVTSADVGEYMRMVVKGLCENNETLDALVIVRKMVGDERVVGGEVREWVYRSLLREAWVKEAVEVKLALAAQEDGGEDGKRRVVGLLDTIIHQWTH